VDGSKDSKGGSCGYRHNDGDCEDDENDQREKILHDQLMLTTPIMNGARLVDKAHCFRDIN